MAGQVDFLAITTLVGGTVGGYITYAGAHRLLDAGVRGRANVAEIARASVAGVLVTGVMRTLLFLAVLGVVAAGVQLDPANPAASAFEAAAGEVGLAGLRLDPLVGGDHVGDRRLVHVGLVSRRFVSGDWSGGAAPLVVGFILASTLVFVFAGAAPVPLLIFAGAFNGLILPIGVGALLWVALRRRDLMDGYRYPRVLALLGVAAWLVTIYLGCESIGRLSQLLA